MRRATVPAANRSRVSGNKMMNSSPPSRDITDSLIGSVVIVAAMSKLVFEVEAHHVVGTDQLGERVRQLLQHHVGRLVADRVVDELEVVDVDEQQRELRALAPRSREHFLEMLVQEPAVRQPREAVLIRERADLLVRFAEPAQRVLTQRRFALQSFVRSLELARSALRSRP